MNDRVKAIIFDIDDTLFDRAAAQRQILAAFRTQYGELFEDIDHHMLATIYYEADRLAGEYFYSGNVSDSIYEKRFELFLTMMGLETDFAKEMAEFYLSLYDGIESAVDNSKKVVSKLSKKYRLGIISNGLAKTQYSKLDSLGIRDSFQCVLISEETGILKPEPEIFWQAAEKLGHQVNECLYVGNSYNGDVIGSKEAGMLACWYNPQKTRPAQMIIQPDYEITQLDELLEILN